MRNGGGGGGRKGRCWSRPAKKNKTKKHSAVCLPCNPGVFRVCESVVGGDVVVVGWGALRTNKQRRRNSSQQRQQQTLGGTSAACRSEHREQTHPLKVKPPPRGSRRLAVEHQTRKQTEQKIYIYELSNGLRNANCVFRISFRAAAKKKRGNVHSLSIATTPVTAVTRSVPPSGSRSVCPSVRLPLSSPSMATFSRGFTLPSEPKLKDGPHERPQTNHRRPSTWGLQMLISGGPMAIAHTARLPFDPVELRDVRPINAAAWRRASGRASLGRPGGGRGRSEGRRRRRRVPAVNQSNVGLQAGAGA